MFSWLSKDASRKKEPEAYATVADGLKKLYKQKMLPLEEHFKFHDFHSPPLDDPDFDAKPMVLLVGQYSTGKTTFIRYLLEQVTTSRCGFPKTRRYDGTADGTAINKYIRRDSPQSVDNYPISTQNPTEYHRQ